MMFHAKYQRIRGQVSGSGEYVFKKNLFRPMTKINGIRDNSSYQSFPILATDGASKGSRTLFLNKSEPLFLNLYFR